ncbi:MAG: zinc ABC transporter substrate-binding protein [Calditrichia bacterium]
MRYIIPLLFSIFIFGTLTAATPLKVVTTLTTYADIAKTIGGDKVEVTAIVAGNQDAHFVRPKPSYALLLKEADLFVTTGLDLELWASTLIDMSKNPRIRSGQPGYVAAAEGVALLDKPSALSRSEGDLHIYGNPHITTNPLNFKTIAENIAIGLKNVSPQNAALFEENLQRFKREIDERTFGKKLVELLGGDLLTRLAQSGQLHSFLREKQFNGQPLAAYLGGWLQAGENFYGQKIAAYHKNWTYFRQLFGLEIVGYVEPKPGIPPSPRHVEQLIEKMKRENVRVVLAANYFDEGKVRKICNAVGARPVIVPLYVDPNAGIKNVFQLVDFWVEQLNSALSSQS